MAKVRCRAVKPKIQKGDFSKKKVKVGRKVKRANVTEIKVKSRRIVVPLQNQGVSEDGESNRESINRLIKQLHHYSESTRLNALNRVKEMLHNKISEESFVTLVLPEVIELLFNDEKETRNVVTEVVILMMAKFPVDAFLPVISVTVTYLCSGLTNIHKGIRKDSLVLLKAMAQKCPVLLVPYMEKLLRHTLVLLTDSFQSVSAPLVQQRDVVVTTGMQVQSKSGAAGGGGGSGKAVAPTMFILILEVLVALLEQGVARLASGVHATGNSTDVLTFRFNTAFASNAAVLLTRFDSSAHGGRALSAGQCAALLPLSLAEEITQHVVTVWQNLVMNSSALSIDVLASLQACTKILLCLSRSQLSSSESFPTFGAAVHVLFQHFPHSCTEAALAVPGSEKERQGRLRIAQLDTSLCELAFIHLSAQTVSTATASSVVDASHRLRAVATTYLLQTLRGHVETVSGVRGESPGEPERHAAVKIFKSFELLLSKNTLGALQELLELLYALFAALRDVRPSARRGLNYLTSPATECLCCVIDRLHAELSCDYEEALFVLLVDSLAASLSLALTATWDQTAILAKLADASLNVFKGRASTFDSPCMEEALARLCATYESVWVSDAVAAGAAIVVAAAASAGKLTFHNGYATCSERARLQLLDTFLYAPFEDLFESASRVLDYLCASPAVTLAEQTYFLRLLFERRQQLGLQDFVELLFLSLQNKIDSAADRAAPQWAERWYAHEVADLLCWMASAEAPGKVVLFVSTHVQALVDSLREKEVDESSGGGGSHRGEWVLAAVFVICKRLLVPWTVTTRLALERQSVPESERPAVASLVHWVAAAATCALSRADASRESIAPRWHALAALMSLRLDDNSSSDSGSSSGGSAGVGSEEESCAFPVYRAVLRVVAEEAHLARVGAAGREAILRNLQAAMQSACFDEQLFVQCKEDLKVHVCAIAEVGGSGDENAVALLRNLASDLLSLF